MTPAERAEYTRQVKVSESGQFSVPFAAIARLASFKRDLACLQRIAAMHRGKR